MSHLFLDTSFIIALEDADDQNHFSAMSYWKKFKKHPDKLSTTTYVFDETVTFLKKRISYEKAVEVGNRLLSSPMLYLVHVSQEDFKKGWTMFQKYTDKGFSFTDCLSFIIMGQQNINEALAFDDHFRQMSFLTLPS
jgi:predicted nucleic acid-binding protein